MRIFNKFKTLEIQSGDVNKYTQKVIEDKLFVCHHPEVKEVKQQAHYEIVKTYPNGGKDVKQVVDVEYVKPQAAYDEFENILRVEDLSREEVLDNLRQVREIECFPIINRGMAWYALIDNNQNLELARWYKAWLDVTDNYKEGIDILSIIPSKPEWLK